MKPTAIITGSSSGIGSAIAKELSAKQYNVVINSAKSIAAGEELARDLANAVYIQAELSTAEGCQKLIDETIAKFGQLDVLINNAAFSSPFIAHEDFDALTDDIFENNFNLNVLAPWRLSKAAQTFLKQSKNGNIINISSIAGIKALGSSIAYATSKAALNHLTKLLAKAMAPDIRVNAVAPGIIDTPRIKGEQAEILKQKLVDKSLVKRAGETKEIAEAVSYLLECEYITGQIITVDGGTLLNH